LNEASCAELDAVAAKKWVDAGVRRHAPDEFIDDCGDGRLAPQPA